MQNPVYDASRTVPTHSHVLLALECSSNLSKNYVRYPRNCKVVVRIGLSVLHSHNFQNTGRACPPYQKSPRTTKQRWHHI